jgi:hypothetical protein
MKPKSFQITLLGILLTTTFQCSCSARASEPDLHSVSSNPAGQSTSSDDEQLLREVQQFASSDERDADAAWRSLQSHDRSKLIKHLTRISDASTPDDRNRALIAFTLCNLGHEYASNRKIVVSALSKNPPFKQLLGDWAVDLVSKLMIRGDRDLLVPLFSVSEWSDGAMSTALAHAYSQALAADTGSFLQLLSSQSEATRDRVLELLKSNSLTTEETARVRFYLKNVSHSSKLHLIAGRVMKAID